jgi:DNA gyrase subunit A
MGRATSGVGGIRLRRDDDLLSMQVARAGTYAVLVTDLGYGKRTPVEEWNRKNRNIQGVRAIRLVPERGGLVGALVCEAGDEILAIADGGVVIRTPVEQIRATGRDTMGVALMDLGKDRSVVAIARAAERDDEPESPEDSDTGPVGHVESGETSQTTERAGTLSTSDGSDMPRTGSEAVDSAATAVGATEEDQS